MGGLKFGGGSMGALNIWTQNALKEQMAKREEDRRIDAAIKMARLRAQLEEDLNEKKYQFDAAHGLLEKPRAERDPNADYRARKLIDLELNPPRQMGQTSIRRLPGGYDEITLPTGEVRVVQTPKAGRATGGNGGGSGGGGGGGVSYTGGTTGDGLLPGYVWKTGITANGKVTRTQIPDPSLNTKGGLTEEKAFEMWDKRRAAAIRDAANPAEAKKFAQRAWNQMPQKARDLINAANNPNVNTGAGQPAPGVNVEKAKAIVSNAQSNGMSRAQFVALVAQSVKEGKTAPEEAQLVLSMWPETKTVAPQKTNLNIPAGMTYRVGAEDYVPTQGNQFGTKTKQGKKKVAAITYSPPARTTQWGK